MSIDDAALHIFETRYRCGDRPPAVGMAKLAEHQNAGAMEFD